MKEYSFALIGDGGQADEAESYLGATQGLVIRAVDEQYVNDSTVSIEQLDLKYPDLETVVAVGPPLLRQKLVAQCKDRNFTSIVASSSQIDKTVSIAEGTIIGEGTIITTNVQIGSHSLINIACTISHNSTLGNFATVSPGVHIAGNVKIGDGVFIGIGATISNGIKIANGVVIGAGAVVMRDIPEENAVYVGVPARKVSVNDGWLNEI